MKNEYRFDAVLRLDALEKTPEGYYKGRARITRTGVFPYRADDGSMRLELRHPDDVFAADSLKTLDKLPMQVEHRAVLDVNNTKQFKVGHLGSGQTVDSPFVESDFVVDTADGVKAIDEERRKELSMGYRCDVQESPAGSTFEGQPYTHRQKNIRYNHMAITKQARLGPELRLDSAIAQAIQQDGQTPSPEESCMTQKVKTDNGLHYDAAPEVAAYVSKLETRADSLQRENEKLTTDAAADKAKADARIATLEGERDQAKADAVKSKTDLKTHTDGMDAKIRQFAKDRADLIGQAGQFLKEEDVAKLDSLSDVEIMKAVVVADSPDTKLDGKEDLYVRARFDAIVDKSRKDGSPALAKARAALARQDGTDPKKDKSKDKDGDDKMDSDESRKALHTSRQDAWKKSPNGKKE